MNGKKIEKNTLVIGLNILYILNENFYTDIEIIYPAYASKNNSEQEKQILLIIPNEVGRHYIALTKLLLLLRRITSTHNGNCYCLNCLHSFRAKNKLESNKRVCRNKRFLQNWTTF